MIDSLVSEALDLEATEQWLLGQGILVDGPLAACLIEGGRSNLTFFLSDEGGRRWVLRRPPLGSVLLTAHDVGREFRVMSALAQTDVPVPAVIGEGVDRHGVPFYVMEEVPGIVLRDAGQAAVLDESARDRCGSALVESLASLHGVNPAAVGLDRLGRGDDYLARQISMWQRQAEQHRNGDFPEADAVRDRLLVRLPAQQETTLVHGDYRLDNTLVDKSGQVQAVLDWELCTRGDPIVDLAVFLYYWTEARDVPRPFPDPPSLLPGFPNRDDLLERYVAISGRAVTRWDYYLAYAAWRLALVFEGVAGRSATGAYGEPDSVEEHRLGEAARQLVVHAAELLDRDGS